MKKKLVIALGGNALLQRGEILSAENQQRSIQVLRNGWRPWLAIINW